MYGFLTGNIDLLYHKMLSKNYCATTGKARPCYNGHKLKQPNFLLICSDKGTHNFCLLGIEWKSSHSDDNISFAGNKVGSNLGDINWT